ncbi:hypothetical protein BJP48_30365 [Paenibacillus odorifer]|nr:hypothetical protein BJP48_30365 [Paenibacillus odorifer]
MSKLTEIKEVLSKITQGIWWHYQTNNSVVVDPKDPIFIRKTVADCGNFDNAKFIANAPEYITCLLSLLEEKDENIKKNDEEIENMLHAFQMLQMENSKLENNLEEKDKALAFYADRDNYDFNGRHSIPMFNDNGDIARKALNTSSNNEGE